MNTESSASVTTITVVLNPIMGEEEVLDPNFSNRPPLTLFYPSPSRKIDNASIPPDTDTLDKYQGSCPLSLGRNVWTRIFDTKISRKLATLEFRDVPPTRAGVSGSGSGSGITSAKPRLMMRINQAANTHRLCINGSRVLLEEIEIIHNDEICLYADKYKYKVITFVNGSPSPEPHPGEASSQAEGNMAISQPLEIPAGSRQVSTCVDASGSPSPPSPNCSQETSCSCAAKQPVGEQQEAIEPESSVGVKRQHASNDSAATDQIQNSARSHIIDELTCTICMEIIVHCHVANPCGHVFCKTCIDRIPTVYRKRYNSKSCPTCRKEIASLSWMRCLDNIIWNMVLSGEIFGEGIHGEEDLNQFMRRCGKDVNDLTEEQRACIFRRCKKPRIDRGGDGDGSSEDFSVLPLPPLPPSFQFPIPPVFPHSLAITSGTTRMRTIGSIHNTHTGRTAPHRSVPLTNFLQIDDAAGTMDDPICLDD